MVTLDEPLVAFRTTKKGKFHFIRGSNKKINEWLSDAAITVMPTVCKQLIWKPNIEQVPVADLLPGSICGKCLGPLVEHESETGCCPFSEKGDGLYCVIELKQGRPHKDADCRPDVDWRSCGKYLASIKKAKDAGLPT